VTEVGERTKGASSLLGIKIWNVVPRPTRSAPRPARVLFGNSINGCQSQAGALADRLVVKNGSKIRAIVPGSCAAGIGHAQAEVAAGTASGLPGTAGGFSLTALAAMTSRPPFGIASRS